jgi:hypothetical protein
MLIALQKEGGEVKGFEELREPSGYGETLSKLPYSGAKDSQGLTDLGLVEVKRGDRGRSIN